MFVVFTMTISNKNKLHIMISTPRAVLYILKLKGGFMIFFRNFRERMKLLEYENEMIAKKIQELEKHTNFHPKHKFHI